ncbi:MAG: UDP-N-acetylglucosamine 1-carboxyvinyltransferase [Candidatus Kaiserbacteria bacterium]|nr:UDP-N-acetylglucosamine 1-carboxyvinyltransferase [Candidatus Kaiserbacteria bacterium]
MNYHVIGGKKLSGTVQTNISKNATVALLAASLLNKGTTTIRRAPHIEEAKRLIEVLQSIGVQVDWQGEDIVITPPSTFTLESINRESAERTRSIAMFIPALAHHLGSFELPAPGGCDLGKRTLGAHVEALARLGIHIGPNEDGTAYKVTTHNVAPGEVIMYEASDTGVENVLMAAALIPGVTTIKFASSNYMVQDLCVFLEGLGVRVEGIGTSTLVVHGIKEINMDAIAIPTEDPIESMFFISLAATTDSELTITRCPIDFLELELYTLNQMGLKHTRGEVYLAENKHTRLVDITIQSGATLIAPPDKIHARPYPGINIDNLPFFVPVATRATGRTLIHDWVYDGRALHYMEMTKLGADMVLADPHRVFVTGPTPLHGADVVAPPALRPATILLIGMLAGEGESTLRNVYPINRGYENLHERLQKLGASIEAVE